MYLILIATVNIVSILQRIFINNKMNTHEPKLAVSSTQRNIVHPAPDDVPSFLPWACTMLQLDKIVEVHKIQQDDYESHNLSREKSRCKAKDKGPSVTEIALNQDRKTKSGSNSRELSPDEIVKLKTFYSGNNLARLKFDNNTMIPRSVLKLIGLIIPFNPHLHSISINRGINKYGIYEISKFLSLSNITEICLDDTFVCEGNYYILLENASSLKSLSLARCEIGDSVTQSIAMKLKHLLPAAKTLSILNLSCNKITDVGARYLGQMLRSNRHLSYLNLASNLLTDEGVNAISDSLKQFPLTSEETLAAKRRLMIFLNERNKLINTLNLEYKAAAAVVDEQDRKPKKKVRRGSLRKVKDDDTSSSIDATYYKNAETMAQNMLGNFQDPFNSSNTISKNGIIYCNGNNTLCYLNIAYNNITISAINTLLAVLKFQKTLFRKPRGLINLCIEGNPLPVGSNVLSEIDYCLDSGFAATASFTRSIGIRKSGAKSK